MSTTNSGKQKLRILHLSDLHEHGRREKEAWRRFQVLGREFDDNLAEFRSGGPIDLVFFTGDLANFGLEDEYKAVTPFIERILKVSEVARERFFLIPGNHDIARKVSPHIWSSFREGLTTANAPAVSTWLAGASSPPAGFTKSWREKLLLRQARFWEWVKTDLARPVLLPAASPHGRLGYRVTLTDLLPCSVHVVGLDTSWLAGDDNDAGKLRLTEDQIMRLCTNDGESLSGVRLALLHHPVTDLADQQPSRRMLAENVDFIFQGHMHDPDAQDVSDPDRSLRVVAAGCLYDRDAKNNYRNQCQLIEITVSSGGEVEQAELHSRSWSDRKFWCDDNSYYRNSSNGRVSVFKRRPASASGGAVGSITIKGTHLRLRGFATKNSLVEAWGPPSSNHRSPMSLVVEGSPSGQKDLVEAIFRLGLHGGLKALFVEQPDWWHQEGSNLLTCIGVESANWQWSLVPGSGTWQILSLQSAPPVDATGAHDVESTAYVAALHSEMDEWVWARLQDRIRLALAGSVDDSHVEIHQTIRLQMQDVWALWLTELTAQPGLRRHLFSAMLTPANPLRSDSARARVGVSSTERGLLKGFLFALAVEVGLGAKMQLRQSTMPINLGFSNADAHLVALELIQRKTLHQAILNIMHEPPFLLLANCRAPASELQDSRARIGSIADGTIRVGQSDLASPVTFTADPAFERALRDGIEALATYLRKLATSAVDAQFSRIHFTAGEAP